MHDKWNHEYTQQLLYPSLPFSFYPSYLFSSTLSPSHLLPYSLSHSHHILLTPPYPPNATILPHIKLHNKVVNKLSWIPLPYNDVLEIDKSTLECIDVYKGCDFDDENLTTCCSLCYRKDDQCICLNNQGQVVNEVQSFC